MNYPCAAVPANSRINLKVKLMVEMNSHFGDPYRLKPAEWGGWWAQEGMGNG